MDVVDEAQQLELDRRADALAARRAASAPSHLATGICCDCGDPIEPERLAALPSARRCLDCQALAERTAL